MVCWESDGAEPASPETVGSASSWVFSRERTVSGSAPARRSTGHDDAPVLLEQGGQDVVGLNLRVTTGSGQPLSGREGLLGLDCEAIQLHKI